MDDAKVRIAELKRMVREFSEERDWNQFHYAKDLAIGIVTEASELLQEFRFKTNDEIEALLKDAKSAKNVRDELADIFYFALRFAQKYDIDVSKSLESKMKENAAKYPVDRAKGSNKKYTEFET